MHVHSGEEEGVGGNEVGDQVLAPPRVCLDDDHSVGYARKGLAEHAFDLAQLDTVPA